MKTAYDRIDRFLRENLSDDDYLSYKDELDSICQAKLQRTWQGLTDGEIEDLYFDKFSMGELKAFAKAIEAKLKEKNI